MMKRHFVLALVAGVLAGAACGSPDEKAAQAVGAVTAGSGSGSGPFPSDAATGPDAAGSGFDAGAGSGSGFDAGVGPGSDAGSGFDAGIGPGSDAGSGFDAGMGPGSDAGAGSDAGSGSGSNACGDGLVYLDPYSAQYNMTGDAVALDPHSLVGTAPYAFSATGLPPGLSIDARTGRITGALAATAYAGSPYRVTISITDSGRPPSVRSVSFNWRIDRRALPRYENTVGDAVNVTLPPASGSSPYVYAVSGLPPGLSSSTADGRITGTISPTTPPGPYTVTVSTTGGSASDSYSFLWWVFGPSLHVASEPADQNSWEGDAASLKLPVPNGRPNFTYQATNLPPGLQLDASTATIVGAVAPGAQAGSPYEVRVLAMSSDGVATTFAFRWTVYTSAATLNNNMFGSAAF